MASSLVSDGLWAVIEQLLPVVPPRPKGGRPRISDRAALTGILFVVVTGIPWEMLPQEMGCGSGVTCWRRLRDWSMAGVWDRLHRELLTRLHRTGQLDWSRACMDSASIAAKRGVKRQDLTRQIVDAPARSGTLSLTDRVFRSLPC
jgi:transposase